MLAPLGERLSKRLRGLPTPCRAGTSITTRDDILADAVVSCTDVVSKVPYISKRCSRCNGLSVKDCLALHYMNKDGEKTRYTLADLRYDIQGKRLCLHGGTPGNVIMPQRKEYLANAAPPAKCSIKVAALSAAKSTASAKSLAQGVSLTNGFIMPVIGFGTYKLKDNEVAGPVLAALKAGYRLIDTAQVYENEKGVGAALRQSGLPRDSICIETKVWRSSHGYERTMTACKQSLKKLGVNYIDLYVIHWPGCKTGWPLPKGTMCPKDWTPAMRDTGTWRAMEDLYFEGKVKAIGVTNYSIRHLKQLMRTCRVKPMVNQVEFHPRLIQTELLEFCKKEGIAVQAYASLGSGDAQQAENFFSFPAVQAAALAHQKTPAQVLLRWAIQKGCHVVPKSTHSKRIVENAQVFDMQLKASEMKAIDDLHTGTRYAWKGLDPDTIK